MIDMTGGPGSTAAGVAVLILATASAVKTGGPELREWVKLLRRNPKGDPSRPELDADAPND